MIRKGVRILVITASAIAAVILVSILTGQFLIHHFTTGQCDRLELMARRPDIQEKLIHWVEHNVGKNKEKPYYATFSDGRVPGLNQIIIEDFDWELLGIEPSDGQVRLILAELNTDPSNLANVRSVSFSEVSRASILVRVSGSKGFGIRNQDHLTKISNEVAVYCAW